MNLYNSFKNYLSEQHIKVNERKGSMFYFENDGLNYVFVFSENDPSYFRLLICVSVKFGEDFNSEELKRALKISAEFKVGKLIIIENQLWASFEQYIYGMYDNNKLFKIGMEILKHLNNKYKEDFSTKRQ